MYAIKLTYQGQSNILPYRYTYYDIALAAAVRRREMTPAKVEVIQINDDEEDSGGG